MAFSDAAKNEMLDALAATTVSLHTADPGTTGASEVTGGTYARQSITWNAAATGNKDSSNAPAFNVPGGTTITHVGYWVGATFKWGEAITNETYAADGTYTLTDADVNI